MKTFIFGEIGKSKISHLIQKNTPQINIPSCCLWTHVGALVLKEGKLWIYESHFKAGGVVKYLFNKKELICFEYKLDEEALEKFLGSKYGLKDVTDLMNVNIFSDYRDNAGVFCSEYISKCSDLQEILGKKAHLITPSDIQSFLFKSDNACFQYEKSSLLPLRITTNYAKSPVRIPSNPTENPDLIDYFVRNNTE